MVSYSEGLGKGGVGGEEAVAVDMVGRYEKMSG